MCIIPCPYKSEPVWQGEGGALWVGEEWRKAEPIVRCGLSFFEWGECAANREGAERGFSL